MQNIQRGKITRHAAALCIALLTAGTANGESAEPQAATANTNIRETLTNNSIIQLSGVGLGDEAIIAKIRASDTDFSLSTDDLLALKEKGVSGTVIAAMLAGPAAATPVQLSYDAADPLLPHYPGLYLATDDRMKRIQPTISNQAKTGGILGYAFTAGIASMSVKAAIPGSHAKTQASRGRPTFYAYFDESVPQGLQTQGMSAVWATSLGAATSSPSELSLVRFMEKKGRREARVGSVNIAGAKTGVMDKDLIAFDAEMIAPGVYRIELSEALASGEYGFVQSMTGGGNQGAMTARVFDFSIP